MMPIHSFKLAGVTALATLFAVFSAASMAQSAAVPGASQAPAAAVLAKSPATAATGLGVVPGTAIFYEELGGKAGIDAIVTEFVVIMTEDKRINGTFEGVDLDRLRAKLAEQFCAVSGGPCSYTGKSMAESHEDLKVNNAQFNASVENLQRAMERRGVPSRIQNRLLARLAPTQREIVTR